MAVGGAAKAAAPGPGDIGELVVALSRWPRGHFGSRAQAFGQAFGGGDQEQGDSVVPLVRWASPTAEKRPEMPMSGASSVAASRAAEC